MTSDPICIAHWDGVHVFIAGIVESDPVWLEFRKAERGVVHPGSFHRERRETGGLFPVPGIPFQLRWCQGEGVDAMVPVPLAELDIAEAIPFGLRDGGSLPSFSAGQAVVCLIDGHASTWLVVGVLLDQVMLTPESATPRHLLNQLGAASVYLEGGGILENKAIHHFPFRVIEPAPTFITPTVMPIAGPIQMAVLPPSSLPDYQFA